MGAIRVLAGIEVDILADGSLDLEDSTLAEMDIVVASVHSHFNQPKEEMTARVLRAMENPHVRILGHPTGRKILSRESLCDRYRAGAAARGGAGGCGGA